MTARSPMLRRTLATSVLLFGLLGLMAAGSAVMKIHLFADFETPEESNGAIKAEIGTLKPMAGASVFDVVFPEPDDGVLRIGENHTGAPARLVGELTSPVLASVAHVSFRLTPVVNYGDLVVVLAEDGESGMIDLTFAPDGRLRVGSEARDLPGLPGDELEVRVELRTGLFGSMSYSLTVEGPLGVEEMQGPVDTYHGDLGIVEFKQPGSTNDGIWFVDDLLVTSSSQKTFKNFGGLFDFSL